MSRTVVIVQARLDALRMQGKVMEMVAGQTVIAHVLARCRAIPGIDAVCCAVPRTPSDDIVAEEARRCGVEVFRGSEDDVLDRFYRAAASLEADVVMRVTGDCPLIDPSVCAQVLGLLEDEAADYASNNLRASWPHGLDCEAFRFGWLERAAKEDHRPQSRTHVSIFILEHPDAKRVNLDGPGGAMAQHRWVVDYSEDIDYLRALFELLPAPPTLPSHQEIAHVLAENPELAAINAMRRQQQRDALTIPAHDIVQMPGPSA